MTRVVVVLGGCFLVPVLLTLQLVVPARVWYAVVRS